MRAGDDSSRAPKPGEAAALRKTAERLLTCTRCRHSADEHRRGPCHARLSSAVCDCPGFRFDEAALWQLVAADRPGDDGKTARERHEDFARDNAAWQRRVEDSLKPLEALAGGQDPAPERIRELEAERDEYLNDLKRVAADFENYRKRAAREQENVVLRAAERLVKKLLPVADNLERAHQSTKAHQDDSTSAGLELVMRQLKDLLEQEGVQEIETEGVFDPHRHEAIAALPADVPEGTIVEVMQRGYELAGQVIRPAKVVVAAPEEE